MSWVATIRVAFAETVDGQNEADLQANNCVVSLVESPINANEIVNAVVLSVKEE